LEIHPFHAEAHNNLGSALEALGKTQEAIASYRRALEIKPDSAIAHNNLGNALQIEGKLNEAVDCYRRALELDPAYALALCNLGLVLQWQRKLDEAIACYEQALQIEPSHAMAHFNRSFLWLLQGDFERGWPEYEWRWKTGRVMERGLSQPQWQGDSLGERTILLYAEQGLGDTFQFIRYAALVKKRNPAATVVLEVNQPLIKILERCPGIDRLVAGGDELPRFDVQCALASLPGVFQTTVETILADIPYLFADPRLVEQWRETLKTLSGYRIGINWRGRAGIGPWRQRDLPIELFAALGNIEGVRLVSLQKEDTESKVQGPKSNVKAQSTILDLGEIDTEHGPFMDTAAIMMNLDLVITSDTSVAHLAGALGVPVWVALPLTSDWRWLMDRRDSPWYPTMRLFRQRKIGDWSEVFEEIEVALRERVSNSKFRISV
jgi:tetratricopeptide (TPR) repeat protein